MLLSKQYFKTIQPEALFRNIEMQYIIYDFPYLFCVLAMRKMTIHILVHRK